jgi:ligand-binding sensor domain-containing protein
VVSSFTFVTDLSDVWLSASTTNDLWVCGADPDGAAEGSNPDKSNGNPSTDKRGIWNSQDGGSTWNAKLLGDYNVRTLTVNGQEIYAGTYSGKLFYSANSGGHWVQRTSPTDVTSVRAIRVKGSGDIIIATNNGVFTSADDGATVATGCE